LVLSGVLLMGATFVLSELVPRGNAMASRIQRDDAPNRTWRSDFVYRSENGLDWQVKRLTAETGRMTDVILQRKPTDAHRGLYVTAGGATWREGEGWLLVSGFIRTLGTDSTEHSMEFSQLTMPELTEHPRDLLEVPQLPEEMTLAELDRITGILERSGGDPKEFEVRRGQMLALPVAALVIILFAAPLATSYKRGGAAFGGSKP
jgi:lipopolysaccharide export LptBFGC system permease protein LptF